MLWRRPGQASVCTAGWGGPILAQRWTQSLEGILVELVQLSQVVKSRDQGGLPQVLGIWCRDTGEDREVGNISIGLMAMLFKI